MCLMPCAGGVLIPPTEKAVKLADYLKLVIGLHLVVGVCWLISAKWLDGIFDLLGVAIGYTGIRNQEGYSIQQVLCYCVFAGMDVFWSSIRMITYFSGAATESAPTAPWQFYIYLTALIAAPVIYLSACMIAYYLYAELKNIINEMQTGESGAPPGGDYSYAAPQASNPNTMWSHRESHPERSSGTTANATAGSGSGLGSGSGSTSGFKAFSGPGHRLGGE